MFSDSSIPKAFTFLIHLFFESDTLIHYRLWYGLTTKNFLEEWLIIDIPFARKSIENINIERVVIESLE